MSKRTHEQENIIKRYIGIALFLAGFFMLGLAINGFLSS